MTKYIGGHGNSIAGIFVDGGSFDWTEHAERFYMFTEPEPSYHGVVYTEAAGDAAYIARARTVALRNTGSALSPFNSFLVLQGLQTLSLRMERHVENAMAVAKYLEDNSQVEWVTYAGLQSSPNYDLAQQYTGGRPSALLTFGIQGGFDAGVKFYDALKVFKRLVNIGDANLWRRIPPPPRTGSSRRKNRKRPASRRNRSASASVSRISSRRWLRRGRHKTLATVAIVGDPAGRPYNTLIEAALPA